MTNSVNPTKVVTGLARLSYANIWQAKSINGGTPKFSTSVLIPKSDTVTVTKVNKKKEQGAETKRKLYESAEKLFSQKDFADVSVEEITLATGVTKGTFYVHFSSKDALIALLIADHAARADMDYRAAIDALPDGVTARSALLFLTERIADMLVDTISRENMRKVYQMLLAGTIDTDAVKGYDRELYRLFSELLGRGMRTGEFSDALPADALSRCFVTAIRGVSYEWCIRPVFNLKAQAVEHIRLLIDGITTRG